MTSQGGGRWQWPPRAIVAAVDFEDASSRAVALAGAIAAAHGAALRVLHAERFEPPPYFTLEQITRLEAERRDASVAVAAELTRFVRGATSYPAEVAVIDGAPVDVVLTAAESADLLVVGTHGRRGPSRWWLGSVAERIVRGSPVPVLVTRAERAPAAETFSRVVLVGAGETPAAGPLACASGIAALNRGTLEQIPSLAACTRELLARATLVVVAGQARQSSWGLPDVVADTLGHCPHPVLFLPGA
ncbi:MAG: universal stress protein [Vicinamibacterales bacterium]